MVQTIGMMAVPRFWAVFIQGHFLCLAFRSGTKARKLG